MALSTLLPNSLFVATKPDTPNYYLENDRLASFEGWPLSFLTPAELAKAGFYYTKKEDIVQCPFCNVDIGKWEPGDDAIFDHERWAPNCIFVRCVLNGGDDAGEDDCGIYNYKPNSVPEQSEIVLSGLEKLVVTCKKPKFPEYAVYDTRLKTFEDWPKALKQRPEQLAEAGFYYTGRGDQCVCFHCGGGLNAWKSGDTPWEQHAYWYSNCNFLLLKKTRDFVERVQNREAAPQQDEKPQATPLTAETKETDDVVVNNHFTCKICYSNKSGNGVLFLPCSHLVACPDCGSALTHCPICRKEINKVVSVFLS